MRLKLTPTTIALSALGTIALGLLLVRDTRPANQTPPLADPKDPLAIPPSSGPVTKLTAHLPDGFFSDVLQFAQDFGDRGSTFTGEDILAVLLVESGMDPKIMNGIGCVGLNQICGSTADPLSGLKSVGWSQSKDAYRSLSARDQLQYVRKYFLNSVNTFAKGNFGSLSSRGKLYLMNFNPANINAAEDKILYRRDPNGPATTAPLAEWTSWTKAHSQPPNQDVYALNRGVDFGNKGFINIADMTKFVNQRTSGNSPMWSELRMRLNRVRGAVAPARPPVPVV